MSSGLGHSTHQNKSTYCCSKWALEALAKCTAQGIVSQGLQHRVICVPFAPGVVRTELNRDPQSTSVHVWAPASARMMLGLPVSANGASVTTASLGFYSPEYVSTWTIPEGAPLPTDTVSP